MSHSCVAGHSLGQVHLFKYEAGQGVEVPGSWSRISRSELPSAVGGFPRAGGGHGVESGVSGEGAQPEARAALLCPAGAGWHLWPWEENPEVGTKQMVNAHWPPGQTQRGQPCHSASTGQLQDHGDV